MSHPTGRRGAQQRADRIAAFRAELAELQAAGVLALSESARAQVDRHHDAVLSELAASYDVDVTERGRQLSWGLRIASLLGALALAASAWLVFLRFWGYWPTGVQVAVLVSAPMAALLLTHLAARREESGYFASLAALLALACFVLSVDKLGDVFNMVSTPEPFFAWGLFGLVLAHGYLLRLPLFFALGCLAFWLAARLASVGRVYWQEVWERPESFFAAGALLLAAGLWAERRRDLAEFAPLYRFGGWVALLWPILLLASDGDLTWLPLGDDAAEAFYQVVGFALSAAAIALGIRRGHGESVYTGATGFVILLLIKYVDWWWDWMPQYLFFLVVALTAVAVLVFLLWARRQTSRRPPP